MFKVFAVVAVISVAVYAEKTIPTAAEQEADLVAAGVSQTAAAGLVAIGQKYQPEFQSGDKSSVKSTFEALKAEADAYIKTQSESDQTAYAAFIANKIAEHKNHHKTTPAAK